MDAPHAPLRGLACPCMQSRARSCPQPGTFDEEGRCPARVEMRVQESRRLGASVSTDYSVAQRGLSATGASRCYGDRQPQAERCCLRNAAVLRVLPRTHSRDGAGPHDADRLP